MKHEQKLKELNARLYRSKKQFEKTKNPEIGRVIRDILAQIRGVKEDIYFRREPTTTTTQRRNNEF